MKTKTRVSASNTRHGTSGWNINTTADTSYCILITAKTQCGLNVLTSLPAMLEFRTPLFELPDVSNLALVHVKRGYVTLSWQRPKGRFDYYSVEVTEDEASNKGAAQQWRQLCANGTIIRPDQTEVTCGPFEPCAKLSCIVRTHFNGPPGAQVPWCDCSGYIDPFRRYVGVCVVFSD
ncbi:hypothetical protein MRX96_042899 [Rhipicephalus microplus]